MRNIPIIILLFILSCSYLHAKEKEKVSLQLQWLNQFQFAGYFIAKEKGFYEDVDLEVEILEYVNDIDIVKNIASGKINYATGRTSLVIHRQNDMPVVVLAAIFQHSPSALVVTDEKILTVNNLINKRIMISPDAITSASYMSMLISEGIKRENLILQNHTFNINDLIDKKTDAIASYISNEPYELQKKGIPYRYFHPKDYGYNFYGDLLYTSQKEIEQNPVRVEKFLKASLKGWEYAFSNIEEAAQLIHDKYNTQNKSLDALIFEAKTLKQLAYNKNGDLGNVSYKKFDDIAKVYKLLGMLPNGYTLDGFIYGKQFAQNSTLSTKEKEWIMHNKTLYVATNKAWNPIEFFDDEENYSGIAAGYLNYLEQKLDINFQLVQNSYWHEMISKMKNKTVDMFMAIVPTPNRRQYMNFTTPYIEFPTVIVTKDNVGYIKNLAQLSSKVIAVEQDYYTQELIKKINPSIQLLKVNTTKEALKKVYQEEVFAYIGALPNIGHYIKELKYTNLKINGKAPFKTALSFSTRKDLPILTSILQKTLNAMTQKEHDKIYNKWVNITYEHQTDKRIIYSIIAISISLIIIFFMWNRLLRHELDLKKRFSFKLKALNKKLEKKNCALKELSEIDMLTQIPNRRKCDDFLHLEIERSRRNKLSLCVIMLDLDYFKKINDSYGHKAGDTVLYEISQTLCSNLRVYDFIGRWGGEEFLIVSPNSDLNQAYHLCSKLQKVLKKLQLEEINKTVITISCGIAQFNFNESMDDFIKRADDEMYKAKEQGRDQIFPKINL